MSSMRRTISRAKRRLNWPAETWYKIAAFASRWRKAKARLRAAHAERKFLVFDGGLENYCRTVEKVQAVKRRVKEVS
jgi:hypothetical protein